MSMNIRPAIATTTVLVLFVLISGCHSEPPKQTILVPQPEYTLLFKSNAVEIIKTEDTRKTGILVGEVVPVDQIASALKRKGVRPGDDVGGIAYSDSSGQLHRAAIENLIANGWRREQFCTNTKE
jgi:hypothetical protein